MSGMFHVATSFNQSLSSWDVSNVTNIIDNQPLECWDVSIHGMFDEYILSCGLLLSL